MDAGADASDDEVFGDEHLAHPAAAEPRRDPFDVFWAIYPKRLQKALAREAWPKALTKVGDKPDPATFLIQAAQVLADNLGENIHLAAKPERWLRQELWDDDLNAKGTSKLAVPAFDRRRAVAEQGERDMLEGAMGALNRRRGLAG